MHTSKKRIRCCMMTGGRWRQGGQLNTDTTSCGYIKFSVQEYIIDRLSQGMYMNVYERIYEH